MLYKESRKGAGAGVEKINPRIREEKRKSEKREKRERGREGKKTEEESESFAESVDGTAGNGT